jgi:hypothetical protein
MIGINESSIGRKDYLHDPYLRKHVIIPTHTALIITFIPTQKSFKPSRTHRTPRTHRRRRTRQHRTNRPHPRRRLHTQGMAFLNTILSGPLFLHKPIHDFPVADFLDQLMQITSRFAVRAARLEHRGAERRRDLHGAQGDLAAELAVPPEAGDDEQEADNHAGDAEAHEEVVRAVVDDVGDLEAVGQGGEGCGGVVGDADDGGERTGGDVGGVGVGDQGGGGQEGELVDGGDERGESVFEGTVA